VRHAVVLLGLVALAAPVATAGDRAASAKSSGTVLALEWGKRSDTLVRLDRRTLTPTSRRVKLGGRTNLGWAFSPDGRRLAIGVLPIHGLRIVDVSRMKKIRRVWTPNIYIYALAWLAPRRIVGYAQDIGLFAVDPVSGKALRPPGIAGNIQEIKRAGNRLLVLSGWPRWTIGFARLSVVDPTGRVRTVLLRRIKAGILSGGDPENVKPGLAIDRSGRAFVVGGRDEPVAEVNLNTLAVTYHELPKEATSAVGRTRRAIWLGNGRIAVWGADVVRSGPPDSHDYVPVGLSIVDLRQRTIETVDAEARGVAFTAGALLVSGPGNGLRGYSTAGKLRYQLFPGENALVLATFDSRAWVGTITVDGSIPTRGVIDVTSGTFRVWRRGVPRLLHPSFSYW
jgi:hypothetical protein